MAGVSPHPAVGLRRHTPVPVIGPPPVYVLNGDPVLYAGSVLGSPAADTTYGLNADTPTPHAGQPGLFDVTLHWTYPITGVMTIQNGQPNISGATILGIFIQRSATLSDMPPAGTGANPPTAMYVVSSNTPAVETGWATIKQWLLADPIPSPLPITYTDLAVAMPQNYRMMMILSLP